MKNLHLTIEVSGCPLSCGHCWARGGHYKPMPLADIVWLLGQAEAFCSKAGLSLNAYPMHEILTHPEAAQALRVFNRFAPGDPQCQFEPIATDGVLLAVRDDWENILDAAAEVGTHTFWVALHGVQEVHDRTVRRKGAYTETCLAVERVHSKGFRCGCNVFVTRENIPQFPQLVEALQAIGMDEVSWEVAGYYPTTRLRQYEDRRPEIQELLPLAGGIETPVLHKEKWANLKACTETSYYQKALHSDDEQEWHFPVPVDSVELVCRSNFDLYSGMAGIYGPRHGNLKADGIESVFQSALDRGPIPKESLYFSTDELPTMCELAERWGNPDGRKVYFYAPDMRWRWLDLALAEHRRY